MAYSVEFREAVSCLNERNQKSRIRHREIRRVYGMVSPWQCLPGPVFHPRNFNKTGPGDEASTHCIHVHVQNLPGEVSLRHEALKRGTGIQCRSFLPSDFPGSQGDSIMSFYHAHILAAAATVTDD